MIRTGNTEHIRRLLPAVERTKEQIGADLIDCWDRHAKLRSEKLKALEDFSAREKTLGMELAALITEGKSGPLPRYEDIAGEEFYDLRTGERLLLAKANICCLDPDRPPSDRISVDSTDVREVISRRPLTDRERRYAERLCGKVST